MLNKRILLDDSVARNLYARHIFIATYTVYIYNFIQIGKCVQRLQKEATNITMKVAKMDSRDPQKTKDVFTKTILYFYNVC